MGVDIGLDDMTKQQMELMLMIKSEINRKRKNEMEKAKR